MDNDTVNNDTADRERQKDNDMNTEFIVIGSGELAVKTAAYLMDRDVKVRLYEKTIYSESSVQKMCLKRKIPYELLSSAQISEKLKEALSHGPVKVISAVNTYIFPAEIVDHPNFCGINYHNALLPDHRGMNAEAWAIYDMDPYTGITWHYIDAAVDKGKIISQRTCPVNKDTTSLSLLMEQSALAFEAFEEFADDFIHGTPHAEEQDQNTTRLHRIRDIPNDGWIDLSWNTEKTMAFLRAMDYGKLNNLGVPKIRVDDQVYMWKRYKLIPHDPGITEPISFVNGDMVLFKGDQDQDILLKKVKKAE